MDNSIEDLRFPIGRFAPLDSYTSDEIKTFINDIKKLPKRLKKVLKKWHNKDLDKLYREGGWSARQVIHHMADSHANAYTRFKLAMTEDNPTIRPYKEELWAELVDSKHGSISLPLRMLTATHRRWVNFLETMEDEDFNRTYFHPESKKTFTLAEAAALYAWHCNHHLEHVKLALKEGIGKKKAKKATDATENDVDVTVDIKKGKKHKAGKKEEKAEDKKEEKKGHKKDGKKGKNKAGSTEAVAVVTPEKKESSIVIVSSTPVLTETFTTNRTLVAGTENSSNTYQKTTPSVSVTTTTGVTTSETLPKTRKARGAASSTKETATKTTATKTKATAAAESGGVKITKGTATTSKGTVTRKRQAAVTTSAKTTKTKVTTPATPKTKKVAEIVTVTTSEPVVVTEELVVRKKVGRPKKTEI